MAVTFASQCSLWEYIILFISIANIVTLLTCNYTDREESTTRNVICYWLEAVFTLFYAVECAIKIIAQGLCNHKHAFLRKGWNIVDLFNVLIGYLLFNKSRILYMIFHKHYGMKIFLALRLLKFAYTSKGMKSLLEPLMVSILELPDVVLYLFVLLMAFGIVATSQFKGTFNYRCRTTRGPTDGGWEIDRNITRLCSAYGFGDYGCPTDRYCGSPEMHDLPISEINSSQLAETLYGTLNYDMIVKSVLLNLQIITYEGWTDIMYKMIDSDNSIFARIFFPIFIFVCSFFALNLIVAVIVNALLKNRKPDESAETSKSMMKGSIGRRRHVSYMDPKRLASERVVSRISNAKKNTIEKSTNDLIADSSNATILDIKNSGGEVLVAKRLSHRKLLNVTIFALVLANIAVMSLDRESISAKEVFILDWIDTGFVILYLIEMVLKIWVSGFNYYICKSLNIVDVVINVLGIIETSLAHSSLSQDYIARGFIVIFRAVRIAKLVNKWDTLRDTLRFIWITWSDILNFMILLALFIFIYSIIGMELFANRIKFDSNDTFDLVNGESPSYNFDDLQNALIASYSLVIGDNWSSFLYMYARVDYTVAIIYFYTGIYAMNVFLVNVFVAIILQNFYVDEKNKLWEEEKMKNREFAEGLLNRNMTVGEYKDREKTLLAALKIFKTIICLSKTCKAKKKKQKIYLRGSSFFILNEESKVRKLCFFIANARSFYYFVYFCTILNSVMVTFKTPLNKPNGKLMLACIIVEIFLLVIFCVEIVIKSIAFGLIANGGNSYFRNPKNILDVISTLALLLDLVIEINSHSAYKVLMLLRILRLLWIVTVHERFELSIYAIVKGFPSIINTLAVGMLFFFFLSVIGIHFFKGMFYSCDKRNLFIAASDAPISDVYDCMNYGGEWVHNNISFDNILISFVMLFELMTAKSWWTSVSEFSKRHGYDNEFNETNNYSIVIFIILCTIVGFLYIRAIITGLINFAFCRKKEEIQGVSNLDYSQRKWVNFSKVIFKAAPIKSVMSV